MTELALAGSIDSALTHMALLGLAGILQDQAGQQPRIWWTASWPASATLQTDLEPDDIGQAVIAHASSHRGPTSWVSLRHKEGPRAGGGVFTVRATPMAQPDEWQALATQRREALGLTGLPSTAPSRLDTRMLVALGEPAYWWHEHKTRRPDDGASRWEMKTRNRGEEFIRDRLYNLSGAVSARTSEAVITGLTGVDPQDEVGRNKLDSRTATGLSTPGATDNALAWCALWGLSVAPTIQRLSDNTSGGMAQTPGAWPRNRVHPTIYALPVFTLPTTVGRVSAILTSKPFDRQLEALAAHRSDTESQLWLSEQGVRAIAVFPARVVGSKSAPERQILTGQVHPM